MDEGSKPKYTLNKSDVERQYTCSGGKGGQNVNRRSTCVILTHKPTGIIVRSEEGRTQGKNEEAAWKRLEQKLSEIDNNQYGKQIKETRFNQIGYGNRNDKKRTYREQDDKVIDHETGKNASLKQFMKGKLELLR